MRPDFRRALPSYLSRHRSGVIPEHLPRRHWSRWEPKFGGSPTACLHAPDEGWVAFQRYGRGTYPRDLMLVASSGGRPRLLMRAVGQAVWSPDSKRLAVRQFLDERRSALLSITIETGERTTVARGSLADWSFSPRGDEIAYVRADPAGSGPFLRDSDVCVADLDGRRERRVTNDGDSAFAVWGPREIAFARLVPYRGWARTRSGSCAPTAATAGC